MSVGPRAGKFNIVSNDHGRIQFFSLRPEKPLLGKFRPKNRLLKLKFGTETNSDMQNLMA